MPIYLVVSVAVLFAAIFAFVASFFKQPLLIGYIFAGILLGVLGFFSDGNKTVLESMAHLGITFLLFLVGLEMKLKDLKSVGRVAFATGIGQILFTVTVGVLVSLLLGYNFVTSLYIAIALAFSSTIIIIQLLSEKKDLNSLYGKIAVGFLLVQDFVAVLILILLSGFQNQGLSVSTFLFVFLKGILLIGLVYFLSKTLLPKIFDKAASFSSELLFIASIAWVLVLSSFVSLPEIGFSIQIGGFLAGLALANSSEHLQIASRVKPLRDFFMPIFFLLLGTQMVIGITPTEVMQAVFLSLIVLVGNPIIVLVVMSIFGYKSRTSFLAAITVAQISEFSFILVALGASLGHIPSSIVGLVALVGVVTMTLSTYLITHGHTIYHNFRHVFKKLERKRTKESAFLPEHSFSDHIVLIGAGRTGKTILPILVKSKDPLLIVDFNPNTVEKLAAEGYNVVYGDITDYESLEYLNLEHSKCLISTTNSIEDNMILLKKIKGNHRKPLTIMTAGTPSEALNLYDLGANYVVVPRIVSGEYLADLFEAGAVSKESLSKLRDRHFERLVRERFQ